MKDFYSETCNLKNFDEDFQEATRDYCTNHNIPLRAWRAMYFPVYTLRILEAVEFGITNADSLMTVEELYYSLIENSYEVSSLSRNFFRKKVKEELKNEVLFESYRAYSFEIKKRLWTIVQGLDEMIGRLK